MGFAQRNHDVKVLSELKHNKLIFRLNIRADIGLQGHAVLSSKSGTGAG